MLYTEVIVVYSVKHRKHVNALCEQNAVFLSVLKNVAHVLNTARSTTFAQRIYLHRKSGRRRGCR